MSLVIAFGHRKLVGKDTCAKYLSTILKTEVRGLNLQRYAFADELKDQCHRLYGWAGLKCRQHYEEHPHEKSMFLERIGKTVRDIWIDYGTLVGREVYAHTWVDFLFHRPSCDVMLITDLRFPNEFDRVRELGGLLVKVENPAVPYTDDAADRPLREKPDNEWDCVIDNNGTLNDLYSKMAAFRTKFVGLGGKTLCQHP